MLKPTIRPPAVVETITNEMTQALDFLAKQGIQVHNAIYQNCLASNYLLASEGGMSGKFNLDNCYLQIDDEGKIIVEIRLKKKSRPCFGPDLKGLV